MCQFKTAVIKAATEHLGQMRSKQHEWTTIESRDFIAKRKAIKPALAMNTGSSTGRQKQACGMGTRKPGTAKLLTNLNLWQLPVTIFYRKKNILIGKSSKRASQLVMQNNGVVIRDKGAKLQRLADYFEDLLDAKEAKETSNFSPYEVSEELDVNMEPPSREEIDKAVSLLKRNKAPCVDNITAYIFKDGDEAVRKWLLRVCH